MLSDEEKARLRPLAYAWAGDQERQVLEHGVPLTEAQVQIATRAGVRFPERVRALAVSDVPLPTAEPLRGAAQRTNILSRTCRGIAIGYGVILRGDSWGDRELLAHQLVHVAQYESAGGIEAFLHRFFEERLQLGAFSVGELEKQAREVAKKITAG